MSKLTNKQKRFVDEYLTDLNATQAAIRAGYSAKTASRIGGQLLVKTWVADEIQKAMRKRSEKVGITAEKVINDIQRLAQMAESDGKYGEAIRALELLGKHLKLFTDRVEHSGKVEVPVININIQ